MPWWVKPSTINGNDMHLETVVPTVWTTDFCFGHRFFSVRSQKIRTASQKPKPQYCQLGIVFRTCLGCALTLDGWWFSSQHWSQRSLCCTCVNSVNSQIAHKKYEAVISLHSSIEWWWFFGWWVQISWFDECELWPNDRQEKKKPSESVASFPLFTRCLCHLFVAYCWYRINDEDKKTTPTTFCFEIQSLACGGVVTTVENSNLSLFLWNVFIGQLFDMISECCIVCIKFSRQTNQRHAAFSSNRHTKMFRWILNGWLLAHKNRRSAIKFQRVWERERL